MINQTYNTRKRSSYRYKYAVNDIDSRGLQKFEAIRKTDAFIRSSCECEKLNLIIDIPDRW